MQDELPATSSYGIAPRPKLLPTLLKIVFGFPKEPISDEPLVSMAMTQMVQYENKKDHQSIKRESCLYCKLASVSCKLLCGALCVRSMKENTCGCTVRGKQFAIND